MHYWLFFSGEAWLTKRDSRSSHPPGWSLIWCMIIRRVTSITYATNHNLVKRVMFYHLCHILLWQVPESFHTLGVEGIIQGCEYQTMGTLGFTLKSVCTSSLLLSEKQCGAIEKLGHWTQPQTYILCPQFNICITLSICSMAKGFPKEKSRICSFNGGDLVIINRNAGIYSWR